VPFKFGIAISSAMSDHRCSGRSNPKRGGRVLNNKNFPRTPSKESAQPIELAKKADRKGVQSVDIAFSILRAFERAEGPLSLAALSQITGHQPSKVHHYLVSLLNNGIVVQHSPKSYDLGPFALHLGLAALTRIDSVKVGVDALFEFRDSTDAACFLSVWGSHGPTIVRYLDGSRPVTVEARAGIVLPLIGTATGHAFLTWLEESAWTGLAEKEIAEHFGAVDDTTLRKIREETLKLGIGRTDGELLPRVAGLAVPVFTHEDHLQLTLSALGWKGNFDLNPTGFIATSLHRIGEETSRKLGFKGQYPPLSQDSSL
jgi:DNA-binding IclR family transcriptional regulator